MEIQTSVISLVLVPILTSGIMSVAVAGFLNYYTKIKTIKESGLYKRRADVIDKFMYLICTVDKTMGDMISPFKIGDNATKQELEYERRHIAREALINLDEYYCEARHYLSQKADEKVKSFLKNSKEAFNEYVWEANPIQIQTKPDIEKWGKLWNEQYKKELCNSAEEIVKDFRKIMGITQ